MSPLFPLYLYFLLEQFWYDLLVVSVVVFGGVIDVVGVSGFFVFMVLVLSVLFLSCYLSLNCWWGCWLGCVCGLGVSVVVSMQT